MEGSHAKLMFFRKGSMFTTKRMKKENRTVPKRINRIPVLRVSSLTACAYSFSTGAL